MFCEGPTLLGKVCPKEGTRVRVLGVYHDTAWYGAVGHRGSRGRGSGVVIGERRSGVWQVVPEWVRGIGQAGRTSPAECVQQGRSRGSICVCCTIPTVRSPLLTLMRPLGSISGSCPSGLRGYMSAARHHLPYLRRPPLTVTVRCVLSSYQQRAPRAAASVAMGRLPGNRSRAEARSLGDNVVSGSRARRRSQARSPLVRVVSPSRCCFSCLPHCCANAWAVAHPTPHLAFVCSSPTRLR